MEVTTRPHSVRLPLDRSCATWLHDRFRRFPRLAWPFLVVACALSVGGCAEVSGSPEPPASFGETQVPLFGCPEVEGVYAWPPDAGEYSARIASNVEPWAGGRPVRVGREPRQVWVELDDADRIAVRSRIINRDPRIRTVLARQWAYTEYDTNEYRCSDGAIVVAPVPMDTGEDFGGKGIRRGFRLFALDDGALAVGIQTVAYGLQGSLFAWGGKSYGSYDLPDKTYWSWSRLARLGPGDREPAPIDAGSASGAR
jgi:hypothetical protein